MRNGSVGVGFVGSGSVIWAYLRTLDTLVARGLAFEGPICERKPEAWPDVLRRRPHSQLVATAKEVLQSDVDAVAILTPPESHPELALAALEAGKHVLVEKPLATTRTMAEQVVGRAEALG
jgi:predicted dehydrogenase